MIAIPQPRPEVTEHQIIHRLGPEGQRVSAGEFPPEVTQSVQLGPRIKAAALDWPTYQRLPDERPVETLGDLCGAYPSEGTLATAPTIADTPWEPVEQASRRTRRQAAVAPVDEPGIRVAGHTAWVPGRRTAGLTCYAQYAKRGLCATNIFRRLPQTAAAHAFAAGWQ